MAGGLRSRASFLKDSGLAFERCRSAWSRGSPAGAPVTRRAGLPAWLRPSRSRSSCGCRLSSACLQKRLAGCNEQAKQATPQVGAWTQRWQRGRQRSRKGRTGRLGKPPGSFSDQIQLLPFSRLGWAVIRGVWSAGSAVPWVRATHFSPAPPFLVVMKEPLDTRGLGSTWLWMWRTGPRRGWF